MSLAMSRAEREAFLADTHVGVVSISEDRRGPLTVPVWYRYTPGGEVLSRPATRRGSGGSSSAPAAQASACRPRRRPTST
jgi:hypothetical protein